MRLTVPGRGGRSGAHWRANCCAGYVAQREGLRHVVREPVELAAGPTAVRAGRRLLAEVCQAQGVCAQVEEVAVLLVSES